MIYNSGFVDAGLHFLTWPKGCYFSSWSFCILLKCCTFFLFVDVLHIFCCDSASVGSHFVYLWSKWVCVSLSETFADKVLGAFRLVVPQDPLQIKAHTGEKSIRSGSLLDALPFGISGVNEKKIRLHKIIIHRQTYTLY